jgi:hypothetical protein
MSAAAARVLHLFKDKLASEGPVRHFSPEAGTLEARRPEGWIRLQVDEGEIDALIPGASEPWGPGISDEEGAARLLTIHLDESLATRTAHETGWWTYFGGFFEPMPPWEVCGQRRQRR